MKIASKFWAAIAGGLKTEMPAWKPASHPPSRTGGSATLGV